MVSLEEKLMVLLPKPSAALSMIGSYCLIRELCADRFYHRQDRDKKVIPRALFTLSVADLVHSFAWFLTTWPSPKELPYLWLNVGTTATCTLQGFLIQFGFLWSLGSNCVLFGCYLLILRFNWPDFKLAQNEIWAHSAVFGFALISAVFPLFYGMYNNYYPICWIAEYPLGCRGSDNAEETGGGYDCVRGQYAWVVNNLYSIVPIWSTVAMSIATMSMIYCSVRRLERRNAQYAGSRSTQHMTVESDSGNLEMPSEFAQRPAMRINRKKSRSVAAQGYCYICAFLATFVLDLVGNVIMWTAGIWNWPLNLTSFALMPLQGLFNFLVFSRTRKEMKTPEARLVRRVLCCCSHCFPCLQSTVQLWWRLRSSSQAQETSSTLSSNNTKNAGSNDANDGNNNSSKKVSSAVSTTGGNSSGSSCNNNNSNNNSRNQIVEEDPTLETRQLGFSRLSSTESVEIAFGPAESLLPQSKTAKATATAAATKTTTAQGGAAAEASAAAEDATTTTRRKDDERDHYGARSGGGNNSSGAPPTRDEEQQQHPTTAVLIGAAQEEEEEQGGRGWQEETGAGLEEALEREQDEDEQEASENYKCFGGRRASF